MRKETPICQYRAPKNLQQCSQNDLGSIISCNFVRKVSFPRHISNYLTKHTDFVIPGLHYCYLFHENDLPGSPEHTQKNTTRKRCENKSQRAPQRCLNDSPRHQKDTLKWHLAPPQRPRTPWRHPSPMEKQLKT